MPESSWLSGMFATPQSNRVYRNPPIEKSCGNGIGKSSPVSANRMSMRFETCLRFLTIRSRSAGDGRAKIPIVKPYIPWLLALASLAMAQQGSEKKDTPPPSDQKQDSAPLFKNKLSYKSSKTSKESTTLGFNGIDPSGKVDQKMLATTPGAADQQNVKKMSDNRPAPADLRAFLAEGGLNAK